MHVVGESHQNTDGTSRHELIRTRARTNLVVQLMPEPENLYDDNAVRVCLPRGEQVGYLSSDDAAEFAEQRQAGWHHAAIIHRVLGGTRDKPSCGVLLRLVAAPPDTTEADIRAALESARTEPDAWEQEQARKPATNPIARSQPPRVSITLEAAATPRALGSSGDDAQAPRRRGCCWPPGSWGSACAWSVGVVCLSTPQP